MSGSKYQAARPGPLTGKTHNNQQNTAQGANHAISPTKRSANVGAGAQNGINSGPHTHLVTSQQINGTGGNNNQYSLNGMGKDGGGPG